MDLHTLWIGVALALTKSLKSNNYLFATCHHLWITFGSVLDQGVYALALTNQVIRYSERGYIKRVNKSTYKMTNNTLDEVPVYIRTHHHTPSLASLARGIPPDHLSNQDTDR